MTIHSKEQMEVLLKEVLGMQKDLASFLRSKSEDPLVLALALHTACNAVLDEHEDGSPVLSSFNDMAPRLDAIIDLGHKSVLQALDENKYDQVFAMSVELGAIDNIENDRCQFCIDAEVELGELVETSDHSLN